MPRELKYHGWIIEKNSTSPFWYEGDCLPIINLNDYDKYDISQLEDPLSSDCDSDFCESESDENI